jgi:hypothetical protein
LPFVEMCRKISRLRDRLMVGRIPLEDVI